MSGPLFRWNEHIPRPVLAEGTDYPASFELAEHCHRRSQFLHAERGVMAVSTPQGAWVAPPERAVWIPGGTPHAVRMVGAVRTSSVLVDPQCCPARGRHCQVVGVSPLLRQLLISATEMPEEYEEAGRDGLVMRLLAAEIDRAPLIPWRCRFHRKGDWRNCAMSFWANPISGPPSMTGRQNSG